LRFEKNTHLCDPWHGGWHDISTLKMPAAAPAGPSVEAKVVTRRSSAKDIHAMNPAELSRSGVNGLAGRSC